jgi:ABC-type amino acid transport substrate-binding protein
VRRRRPRRRPNQPPPPTPPGPDAQPPGGEADWARILEARKLAAGTSSGHPPFVYYDTSFALDGFDVALVREVGRRLGLEVTVKDFAPGGLLDALRLGQIDVAIGGMVASPEAGALANFSDPYYVDRDALLAGAGSGIGDIRAAADLAGRKVGVLRGSRREAWLRNGPVATGQIAPADLLTYDDAAQAIADLRAGRIELALLDYSQAVPFIAEGGLKLAGKDLDTQPLALAVPKGSDRLRTEINRVLALMVRDGTLVRLARQYLGLEAADLLPLPVAGPAGGTAVGGAIAGCVDGMAWVQDLTYADNGMAAPPVLAPGQSFAKGWRLRNTGTCKWDTGYRLAYVGGNSPQAEMGGKPSGVAAPVAGGAEGDLYVDLVAPDTPGVHQGFWQMHNADGTAFGERIWVGIEVRSAATPAPTPTRAPREGSFSVDRTRIQPGECVRFTWNIAAVRGVYFSARGEPWEEHPATGQEVRQVCPEANVVYELHIVHSDGSTEARPIAIVVSTEGAVPISATLATVPENAVPAGACVRLLWEVQGDVTNVEIRRDDMLLWDGAPPGGSIEDCPPESGAVLYAVVASGFSQTVQTQQVIMVNP